MKNKKSIIIAFIVVIIVFFVAVIITMNETDKSQVIVPGGETATEDQIPPVDENAIDQPAQTIVVDEGSFKPREVTGKAGTKVSLVFESVDENEHQIFFTDPVLSFIDIAFSKADGNKTLTFPAPGVGTYTFYIDDEANQGHLIVSEKN